MREELGFAGCYIIDVPQRNMFLKVMGIEATQSTEYFSIEGSGAGPDNSIRFIENKQMLVRVYIRNTLLEAMTMTGRLSMHAFNANTLKYDVLRKQYAPMNPVSTAAQSASTRAQFNETLNFLVPPSDCHGNVRLSMPCLGEGHEGDPIYEGEGAIAPVAFSPTRQPIIHCFRVQFTLTSTTPPTVLPAPTFETCAETIRFAERLFPIAGMSIINRGTIEMSGASLITQNDFDAVRQWIQRLRDATIQEDPAGGLILPEENIIYAGFLSDPGGATIWGNADAGSIESDRRPRPRRAVCP